VVSSSHPDIAFSVLELFEPLHHTGAALIRFAIFYSWLDGGSFHYIFIDPKLPPSIFITTAAIGFVWILIPASAAVHTGMLEVIYQSS
jgi:hypothetical protein